MGNVVKRKCMNGVKYLKMKMDSKKTQNETKTKQNKEK